MALKHLLEYRDSVERAYNEAIQDIKDFEKEAQQGLVDPERVETFKKTMAPLINNYQQITYLLFLLNKPNKKEKEGRYLRQNKKLLNKIDKSNTADAMLLKNEEVLEKIKMV